MNALLLAVLLAASPDAPTAAPISRGELAPAEGCFLPTEECLAAGRRSAACHAERDSLRAELGALHHSAVVQIAVGLIVGAAAGVAVSLLLKGPSK